MNKAHVACTTSLLLVSVALLAAEASAMVERRGDWPADDKTVSLSVQQMPRAQALRELASSAGWSLVLERVPDDPVDLEIKEQRASDVLDVLLARGEWVASRRGDLISISPAVGALSPTAQTGPAPASSAPDGAAPSSAKAHDGEAPAPKDRFVMGTSETIAKSESVQDLVVMGGAVEVLGTVARDLIVFGGSATLRPGARVRGDVVAFGASVEVDPGAHVEGDTAAFGGSITRDGQPANHSFSLPTMKSRDFSAGWFIGTLAHSIAHAAFLFVAGALLLAIAPARVESLELVIARRPMRALLHGVFGALAGVIAIAVLAVTCIGIPVAVLTGLGFALAALIGSCAVLITVGAALAGHKTRSPYAHLAVGCALIAALGIAPFVGGVFHPLVSLFGLGAVLATRCAGLVPPRGRADACRTAG